MIQRIQSIFLALIIIGALVEPFLGFTMFNRFPNTHVWNHSYALIIILLTAFLAFATLLSYKQRKTQMLLCLATLTLAILSQAVLVYLHMYTAADFAKSYNAEYYHNNLFAVFQPISWIILSLLAYRFIKKDDELVRSMDRLR
jgi:Domain of unknown function (DUF4293)